MSAATGHRREAAVLKAFLFHLACIAGVAGVGALDWYLGRELSFSIFYLVPLAILGWRGQPLVSVAAAVFAAVLWMLVDAPLSPYSHPAIGFWNGFVRLVIFVGVVALLGRLRTVLERERREARVDPLTGARRPAVFYEALEIEVARAVRTKQPLTVAFIDIDNFKGINDHLGHPAGDAVLREVGRVLLQGVRPTDVVGRLGGDEFGLLLPGLNQVTATPVLDRLRVRLAEVFAAVDPAAGEVGASVGAIVSDGTEDSPQSLLRRADTLMYRAKREGGGRLALETASPLAPAPTTR